MLYLSLLLFFIFFSTLTRNAFVVHIWPRFTSCFVHVSFSSFKYPSFQEIKFEFTEIMLFKRILKIAHQSLWGRSCEWEKCQKTKMKTWLSTWMFQMSEHFYFILIKKSESNYAQNEAHTKVTNTFGCANEKNQTLWQTRINHMFKHKPSNRCFLAWLTWERKEKTKKNKNIWR